MQNPPFVLCQLRVLPSSPLPQTNCPTSPNLGIKRGHIGRPCVKTRSTRGSISDVDIPVISPLPQDVNDFSETTRNHIVKILEQVGWNQTRAAELLGLNRTTLQAKMKKLSIKRL